MKKLIIICLTAFCLTSCAKRKACLDKKPDDVWLVVESPNGTNLIDSLYIAPPLAVEQVGQAISGASFHLEKVTVENKTAWKIDLKKLYSYRQYRVLTQNESFTLEVRWEDKDEDCDYKDYVGRKLNWFKFEDSTYNEPGLHTYVLN